ncbi:glycosyltransferase [bacterium]|nr:MAG: glycosyltransferase [bacterium]
MPRVSILLTCYQHMKYLPEALAGVRAQTFTDYEIIALDDGSTDGTREWLSEQPGITTVFNRENLGTYATLNVGLDRAGGELIAVLNDDDVWEPTKLERQIALLDANPKVGLVHTDGVFIDGEGKEFEGAPLGFRFPRFETGDVLLGLVYENVIIASAALARRKCFDDLGPFEEAYFGSGDWQMWFRIAEAWDVGFVPEKLTKYRVHGANASHKLERIWRDDQRLREWMIPRLEDLDPRFPDSDLRRAKAHVWAALGTVRMLNGRPGEARYASLHYLPGRAKSMLRYAATYLPKSAFRRTL